MQIFIYFHFPDESVEAQRGYANKKRSVTQLVDGRMQLSLLLAPEWLSSISPNKSLHDVL